MPPEPDSDPFDDLLSLEDSFYKEGYDLGVSDGDRAGFIEGRLFGLEKGFEKYAAMGRLHGRAIIWAGRLPISKDQGDIEYKVEDKESATSSTEKPSAHEAEDGTTSIGVGQRIPELPANPRLENHIRALYALTEPGSLSTENTEDAVSHFDDRLKRAVGKIKIVEKLIGETVPTETFVVSSSGPHGESHNARTSEKGDGSIEDISSLHARH